MNEAQQYIKKSFELKNSKLYKEAIELLYKALALENDNKEIISQIGDLYVLLRNFDRAVEQYEKVLEMDKTHAHSAMSLCEIYILSQNFEKALEISSKLCENSPCVENYRNYFMILKNLGNFDKINETFENLDEESKSDSVILYCKAFSLLNKGETKGAKELFEKSVLNNSYNLNSIYELALINFKEKNLKEARKLFLKIPSNASVYNYLGLIEFEQNNALKAVEYFTNSIKLNPEGADSAYNLGIVYATKGWLDEAVKLFQRAVYFAPQNQLYRYALAQSYYQTKKYNNCLIELSFIKENSAFKDNAKILHALCLADTGHVNKAKAELESVENQQNHFLLSSLGKIYKILGDDKKALDFYEKSLEINPNSLFNLNEYVDCIINYRKSYDKALEAIERILVQNPYSVDAYNSLARIYYRKQKYEKTIENLDKAIKLNMSYAEAYYFKGLAQNQLKKFEEAIKNIKTAITLKPNIAKYYAQLGVAYKGLEDYKSAYLYFKEAVELDPSSISHKLETAECAELKGDVESAKFFRSQAERQEKML